MRRNILDCKYAVGDIGGRHQGVTLGDVSGYLADCLENRNCSHPELNDPINHDLQIENDNFEARDKDQYGFSDERNNRAEIFANLSQREGHLIL